MDPAFVLELGSRGKFVRVLQQALNDRRPAGALPVVVDGILGPRTLNAAASALRVAQVSALSRADLGQLGVNVALLADLSGHNEGGSKRPVDLDRMAAAGCGGVWLKLTEGVTYKNGEARRQAGAAPAGMLRGGYHFGDPSIDRTGFDVVALESDAHSEAQNYLAHRANVFAGRPPELADVLDLERGMQYRAGKKLAALVSWTSKRRHEACALWVLAWCNVVEQATGRRPWLYLPRWAYQAYLASAPKHLLDAIHAHRLWVASYNGGEEPARMPDGWAEWSAWQFTGSGSLDGVDGKVDLNLALLEDLHR